VASPASVLVCVAVISVTFVGSLKPKVKYITVADRVQQPTGIRLELSRPDGAGRMTS
jgi:hypothetical protein